MNISYAELKAKRPLDKQACRFANIHESQGTGTLCCMQAENFICRLRV